MCTTGSAPGKVLIAGGYLVLDPAYFGLVLATDARFYASVRPLGSSDKCCTVQVRSPQFVDAVWTYTVSFRDSDDAEVAANGVRITQTEYVNGCCRLLLTAQ